MKPGLNPGIQGLRGIAILLVLLNHAAIPGFAGGYVGVDIFFVISGYLIGGLLWREGQRTGRIAIWEFYARRIRRLFPANAVLLLACAAAALLLLAPEEWAEVFSAMRAALLYVINLWFTGRATDYFAAHGAASPFLHLWSLAVEEQFYLVWPWLVVLCLKGPAEHFTRRLRWVTLAVAVVSLAACVVATRWSQPLAFFNMPFRMWEFAAGIALAITPLKVGASRSALLGWLSVGALMAVTLLMDEHRPFPGLWALLPVLCALGWRWTAWPASAAGGCSRSPSRAAPAWTCRSGATCCAASTRNARSGATPCWTASCRPGPTLSCWPTCRPAWAVRMPGSRASPAC